MIAEKSDGAMRDSLSFTDSILNFSPGCVSREATHKILNIVDSQIFFELVSCLIEKDISCTLLKANEIFVDGYDILNFSNGLLNFFRNLLLSKDDSTVGLLEYPQSVIEKIKNFSENIKVESVIGCISEINSWSLGYKDQINKKFYFEFLLLQLKKLLYSKNICIKSPSINALSAEKSENKKTFDLNRLKNKDEFLYEKNDIAPKDALLDAFKKEFSLTSI